MDGKQVQGKRIREIREEKLMTLLELARLSGVSYAYLKDIETKGRQPSGIIVHRIREALNVPLAEFTHDLPAMADGTCGTT
jgi:transcriptional regulator with XRE-family HTH domain